VVSILVRLVLITLLVYAAVQYWYGRVEKRLEDSMPPEKKVVAAAPVEPQEAQQETATADNDHQVIVSRNIFKAALDTGEDLEGDQEQAELEGLAETKLQLALLGTVTGGKDDARAIIRDEKTQLEDLYQVGSQLQGAEIVRITRGKVVLQVRGREEVLTIKDPGSDDGGGGGGRDAIPGAEMTPPTPAMEAPPPDTMEQRVPEAMPRRRISFRNPAPVPPAAKNEDNGVPGEEQPDALPADSEEQLLPDDERPGGEPQETEPETEQPAR